MNNEEQESVENEIGNEQLHSPFQDLDMLDEQWQSLSQDWQAQPFKKTDMQALVSKTKKRTYWAKALLALDVLATVFIFVMFVYGFYAEKWSTATQTFLFCSGIGSIIYVYYEFQIRLNTWQQNCGSPDNALTNGIASCQSSIKYIKLIKLWFWITLPGVNWYLYVMSHELEKSLVLSAIIINGIIVITWLVTHVFHKKRIKELKELSQI